MINEIKTILHQELIIKIPKLGKSKINQLMVQSLRLLLIEENLEQSLTVINQILKKRK